LVVHNKLVPDFFENFNFSGQLAIIENASRNPKFDIIKKKSLLVLNLLIDKSN